MIDTQKIREFRRQRGLTQGELADRIGCARNSISRAEKGYCSEKMARQIAEALGVDVQLLLADGSAAILRMRIATFARQTKETQVEVRWNLDGRGSIESSTGVGFLDHMLAHLAKHSLSDIAVIAKGDVEVDDHHTVEDVGICLGKVFAMALGDKAGIYRYGWASVPMEETLANVALDISGRAEVVFRVPFIAEKIGAFDTQLIEEFLRALCREAGINLHVNVPYGANDHHMAEAVFKAVAHALRMAKAIDPQRRGDIPSTKGTL